MCQHCLKKRSKASQRSSCRFKRVSYTVEAVIPDDSARSSSGQAHVEQLQKVESELLGTREELRVFEKHYREVRGLLNLALT